MFPQKVAGNIYDCFHLETQTLSAPLQRICTGPCDKVDVAGRKNKCYICTPKKESGSEYSHVEHLEAALTCCAIMLTLTDAQRSMAHVPCTCGRVNMF